MNPNFGSGSNILGDLGPLKQLMAERGIDSSILNQVSGAAPTSKPNLAPSGNLPQGAGIPQPIPGGAPQPMASQPAPQGLPAGNPEAQTIVKALSARLSSLSKTGV